MADRYIDSSYVGAFVGTAVVTALLGDSTLTTSNVLNPLIEAATAEVQAALRNSGYTATADTVGDGVLMSDPAVRLATMGALFPLLFGRAEFGVAKPDDWAEHPANQMRVKILNGDANLSLTRTVRDAVGGVAVSAQTGTYTAPRATRTELADY